MQKPRSWFAATCPPTARSRRSMPPPNSLASPRHRFSHRDELHARMTRNTVPRIAWRYAAASPPPSTRASPAATWCASISRSYSFWWHAGGPDAPEQDGLQRWPRSPTSCAPAFRQQLRFLRRERQRTAPARDLLQSIFPPLPACAENRSMQTAHRSAFLNLYSNFHSTFSSNACSVCKILLSLN